MNHDEVDFVGLGKFMEEHFYCGEAVRVRFPNDTIDPVTVHYRKARGPQAVRCRDFGEILLEAAPGARTPIPIRERWAGLHHLKDRTHAPPPMLLPFVIQGSFEAVMMWIQQASMHLNIRAADIERIVTGTVKDSDYEGHLTPELAAYLGKTFGIPYQAFCLLDKLASSELPVWARNPE